METKGSKENLLFADFVVSLNPKDFFFRIFYFVMLNIAPFCWKMANSADRDQTPHNEMSNAYRVFDKIWEKKENATQTLNWKWTRPTDKAMQVHSS